MIEDGAYFKGSIEIDRTASGSEPDPRQACVFPDFFGFHRDVSRARVLDKGLELTQVLLRLLAKRRAGLPSACRQAGMGRPARGAKR